MDDETTEVLIELDRAQGPITGSLRCGAQPSRRFAGMIELIALLDRARPLGGAASELSQST